MTILDPNDVGPIKRELPKSKRGSIYTPIDNSIRSSITDSHSFSGSDIRVYMRIPNFFYRNSDQSFVSETFLREQVESSQERAAFLDTPEAAAFTSSKQIIIDSIDDSLDEERVLLLSSPDNYGMEDNEIKDQIKENGFAEDDLYTSKGFPIPSPGDQASYSTILNDLSNAKEDRDAVDATPDGVRFKDAESASRQSANLTTQLSAAADARRGKFAEDRNNLSSFRLLDEIQSISMSTHVGYSPVRILGSTAAIDYTTGARTVAGTMVFTVFAKNVFDNYYFARDPSISIKQYASSSAIERLPRFHLMIFAVNEYGAISQAGIKNVQLLNFGTTFSVDDMFTESQFQFVAEDYQDLTDRHIRPFFESNEVRLENPYDHIDNADQKSLVEVFGGGVQAGKKFAIDTFDGAVDFFKGDQ